MGTISRFRGQRNSADEILRCGDSAAGSLRMTVVAEGVQDEEQRAMLITLGCETGQGFLFSKPVSAAAAERALASEISTAKLALA